MTDGTHNVTDQSFGTDVLTSAEPVLVDFWAQWCTPCKLVGPLVAESAKTYAGRLKVVKLDIDENPGAASRYRVRSIPTLMLFKGGVPVATQVGALSKAQLALFVEPHLATPELVAAQR
ncbi:MAG: thioredoxin [Gammaproteobacteria bacterium]